MDGERLRQFGERLGRVASAVGRFVMEGLAISGHDQYMRAYGAYRLAREEQAAEDAERLAAQQAREAYIEQEVTAFRQQLDKY
jgi:hypothetical protein